MPLPAQIGNYRLERELGRGASSEVWLARHAYLGEHAVAIKVLMSQERETVRRFKREAVIAARLRHANTVQLLDYGQCEPYFYAVMELIEGQSLRDLLAARHHLSLPDACAIFTQIAAALDYAHTRGIVHRDVSPANILIEEQTRRALLSDFGIARDAAQPITQADTVMGTSGFHSPEHAQSAANVTHLSDIFSLGVVLYHMLSGELPWHNVPSLADKDEFSPPIPLAERGVEGLPPEVDRVLRTMLALDPSDRYPTAALPAAELRQIIARHETKTQRIGAPSTFTRPIELQASGVEPNPLERLLAPDLDQVILDRTHRRADDLRDPTFVGALLDQWAAQDRWRRTPLLGRLARLHKVTSRNVYFYRLRILYERREPPEDDEQPDRDAEVFPVERELAPWDLPLPTAESFTDNPGGRVHLPGPTRVIACQPCAGNGFTICPRCQGRQRIPAPPPSPYPSASRPLTPDPRPLTPASRTPASDPRSPTPA
ncbi:MAG: serine/threonine protein kinase, partial [Candidatus Viridilinea halotolerans]